MTIEATLTEELEKHAGVRVAVLFGSRATGKARPDSDADIAVFGDDVDPVDLAAALSAAVGVEVDIVRLEEAGYPLPKHIVEDGIVLEDLSRRLWCTRHRDAGNGPPLVRANARRLRR